MAIAFENEVSSLADIVKAISKVFTKDGLVRQEPLEQFSVEYPLNLMYSEDQKKTALDLLTTHLPLESNFVKDFGDELNLNPRNIVANMERTVKDFMRDHNLKPIKLLIHGPRLTGKTELARKLAEYYGLKYLNPDDLVDHRKQFLQNQIKHCEHGIEMLNLMNAAENENASFDNLMEQLGKMEHDDGHDEPSIGEEHEEETLESLTEQIMILTGELNQLEGLNGKHKTKEYEDVIRGMIREQLNRRSTQYHGYVMDGWPDSAEACKALFAKEEIEGEEMDDENEDEEEDEEGEEVDEELNELNRHMLPDIVISLEASQDWLVSQFKSFMTNHPDLFPFIGNQSNLDLLPSTTKPDHSIQDDIEEQSVNSAVYYGENENVEDDETRMMREFVEEYQQFRRNNAYPKGFTPFFNEILNFPLVFNVEEDSLADILDKLIALLGTPRVLLGEEYSRQLEEARRREAVEFEQFQHCLQDLAAREKTAYEFKMEQWAGLNNILHYERSIIQDLFNMPLRHYLMKYVLPLVTRGMNDVTKFNPACPVDYLAEYFFKENPEFKFSDVHYNAKAEHFFNTLCAMKEELEQLQ
uniref:Adenylate kinase 7 n=1 Tax=Cacopsylla melanoneura TaxID=428564 RepID=A0A8D8QH71_9HEMI